MRGATAEVPRIRYQRDEEISTSACAQARSKRSCISVARLTRAAHGTIGRLGRSIAGVGSRLRWRRRLYETGHTPRPEGLPKPSVPPRTAFSFPRSDPRARMV